MKTSFLKIGCEMNLVVAKQVLVYQSSLIQLYSKRSLFLCES